MLICTGFYPQHRLGGAEIKLLVSLLVRLRWPRFNPQHWFNSAETLLYCNRLWMQTWDFNCSAIAPKLTPPRQLLRSLQSQLIRATHSLALIHHPRDRQPMKQFLGFRSLISLIHSHLAHFPKIILKEL